MTRRKYQIPNFLEGVVDQVAYEKWLHRKAMSHIKRDRNRGNSTATNEAYKIEIHRAVSDSNGVDYYTEEKLNWTLLSKYNNEESKKFGRSYKSQFALLPSVDHVDDGKGRANFVICGWRTNDAKNDLSYGEFIKLCIRIVRTANKRTQSDAAEPRR